VAVALRKGIAAAAARIEKALSGGAGTLELEIFFWLSRGPIVRSSGSIQRQFQGISSGSARGADVNQGGACSSRLGSTYGGEGCAAATGHARFLRG